MRQRERQLDTPKFRDFDHGMKNVGLETSRGAAGNYERSFDNNYVKPWIGACAIVPGMIAVLAYLKQFCGNINRKNKFDPEKDFQRRRYGKGKLGFRRRPNRNESESSNNNNK